MLIDVDALEHHLKDELGTAVFNGSPAAFVELSDIERMSGEELCASAEEMGIDLSRFKVDE